MFPAAGHDSQVQEKVLLSDITQFNFEPRNLGLAQSPPGRDRCAFCNPSTGLPQSFAFGSCATDNPPSKSRVATKLMAFLTLFEGFILRALQLADCLTEGWPRQDSLSPGEQRSRQFGFQVSEYATSRELSKKWARTSFLLHHQ